MSSESPLQKKPRARRAVDPARAARALRRADAGLVVAFLALTVLLGVFPMKDTDFWWHLRTGDLIRQSGQVPRHDLYTFTVPPDHPWIDLHWAFQVALSWGYERGGVVGLNLAKCGITCVAVLLLISARRRDWPVPAMLLAWLPALLVLSGRMYIRPETFSLLFLALDLAILFRWDRRPWLALGLPIVQVCWVNVQGLFVLGPILIGFALVDAALRPGAFAPARGRWWRIVLAATGLTGLACLVNPYGPAGALYPLELARTMGNPVFTNAIGELTPIPLFIRRSVGWNNVPLLLHVATMIVGALSFLVPIVWAVSVRLRRGREPAEKAPRRKGRGARADGDEGWRLSPFRLLLFVAFSALSWRATRNSHQFAAVVGTVTAWNVGEWLAARRRHREPGGWPARVAAFGVLAALFAAVASGQFYRFSGEGRTIGLGEEPLWYPHEATRFAGSPGMPTRFLSYHDGYAALYEYYHGPGRKVYADARLEVIGPELYERYLNLRRRIIDDAPGWAGALDEAGRPAILTGNADNGMLGAVLMASPQWRCVWFDPIAAVYVHRSYLGAVGAHSVDFAARHFHPEPDREPNGPAALLAEAKALWVYANTLQAQNRMDLCRPIVLLGLDEARRLLRADPNSGLAWKLIGQLELTREPAQARPVPRFRAPLDPVFDLAHLRATFALRQARSALPGDFLTLLSLHRVYQERGMDEEERRVLDRLERHRPINREQVAVLSSLRARGRELQERLDAHPAPATGWKNLSELDRIVTAMLDAGRVAEAARFLEEAYPVPSRTWEVADRVATLQLHLGNPEHARALWEDANNAPGPSIRAARIALTYLVEGDFPTARDWYRKAIAADPALFEAHYGLAVVAQDAGNAREAVAEARQAESLAPNDVARAAARAIAALATPYE